MQWLGGGPAVIDFCGSVSEFCCALPTCLRTNTLPMDDSFVFGRRQRARVRLKAKERWTYPICASSELDAFDAPLLQRENHVFVRKESSI